MSKRCCARNCFNSVLYNRNIAYFSFPKNKEFAERWAVLAGRTDLKEKPLSRIVKYYLCSEHFTANCFIDKDTRQALKRNLPHSIALPTIFKNNLQETMQNANPRHSIEVHNIILLDVEDTIKDSNYCSENRSDSYESVSPCCSQNSAPARVIPKDDFFTCDGFESPCLDDCLESACSEHQEGIKLASSLRINKPIMICRLCFKELSNGDPIIKFEESLLLKEFIGRVMHNQISVGDEMSQVVCKNCENNALLCLIIIQQMDAAQEKIILTENK